MIFDAHNHFHDARLNGIDRPAVLRDLQAQGLRSMVVNGTHPDDWPAVLQWASDFPEQIVPACGVHPWKVSSVDSNWEKCLIHILDSVPGPIAIGEIGLDRWIENPHFERQRMIFGRQLAIATERNLPVSIHCLRAWGPLLEALRAAPLPERGIHVHAPGASSETIAQLADLGAYFSVPGSFADPAKVKYRRVIDAIPLDRLLIETDAPDMLPPAALRVAECEDPQTGQAISHPRNLLAAYRAVGALRGLSEEKLCSVVAANFHRFFLSDR